MDKIKFSIIIPVYNVAKFLPRCIESIIQQKYSNIEVLCVNDGSDDNSLEILNEYAQKDSRIKVIDQKNQGVSAARNNGLEAASGDYILFVDGDDALETDSLTIIYEKFKISQPDIAWFKTSSVLNEKKSIWINFSDEIVENVNNKLLFEACYDDIFSVKACIPVWDKVFKAGFIRDNQILFDTTMKYAEDTCFVFQCFLRNPKIILINELVYIYYLHENSATHKSAIEIFKGHFVFGNMLKTIVKENKEKPYIKYFYNYLSNMYLSWWNELYFSDNKDFYLSKLKEYIQFGSDCNIENKRIKKHLVLAKLHLSWLYWKLLRPIGKFCIVLPYRRIKKFFRSTKVFIKECMRKSMHYILKKKLLIV